MNKVVVYLVAALTFALLASGTVQHVLGDVTVVDFAQTGAPEGWAEAGRDGLRTARIGRPVGRDPSRPTTRVLRVIDGDTVDTDKLGRVRLIGVDTPERGRCYAKAATRFTRRRLAGRVVGYRLGGEQQDRYGRTLAYLYRDAAMHELALLRKGYARILIISPNDRYSRRFRRAERTARRRNAGLWGSCRRRAP